MMKAKVIIDFNAQKVLDKGKLDRTQRQFVHLVAVKSDPYVPWLSGDLKGSARENRKSITYSPMHGGTKSYAWIQYKHNEGFGRQGINRGGKRGPDWVQRMWDEGGKEEITREVADMLGGKAD